jgi:hypothetical protein
MIRISLFVLVFLAVDVQGQPPKLELLGGKKIWKDTSDMVFKLKLINTSTSPQLIFDQILDDTYNHRPGPLDNLTFIVEKLENGQYKPFRDLPFTNSGYVLHSRRELLDSIAKIRNPFIQLMPNDTLAANYSFAYRRQYRRGKYRVKAEFLYDQATNKKYVESNWVYFEVIVGILFIPIRGEMLDEPLVLLWKQQKK